MENLIGIFLVLPVCSAFVVKHFPNTGGSRIINGTHSAFYCLTCEDISQPRHCPYVTQCEPNEFCSTEKFIARNGDTRYNVGCKSRNICEQYRTGRSLGASATLCLDCSQGDLSNVNGCGAPGYPSNLGPVCMKCTNVRNPSLCNKIEVCGESQVCHVQEAVEFGDSIFTSSCRPKHECGPLLTTVLGKKRDTEPSRSRNDRNVLCSQCCTGNLCNLQCKTTQAQTGIPLASTSSAFSVPTSPPTVPVPPTPFVIPTIPTTARDLCMGYNCSSGTCKSNLGVPQCMCPPGFTGMHCELDPCQSSACRGKCTYDIFGQVNTCECSYPWTGSNCDIRCDHGYSYHNSTHLCYKVNISTTTWPDASNRCNADFGRLIILDTKDKRDFTSTMLLGDINNIQSSGHVFWIGGSDSLIEGDWRWLNNKTMSRTEPPWNANQPNNILNSQGIGQNCLVFESLNFSGRKAYGFGDGYCQDVFNYICEKTRN